MQYRPERSWKSTNSGPSGILSQVKKVVQYQTVENRLTTEIGQGSGGGEDLTSQGNSLLSLYPFLFAR
jgi:hypothetical protein